MKRLIVLLSAISFMLFSQTVHTVSINAESGVGSLTEAIGFANASGVPVDTIRFSPGISGDTIDFSSFKDLTNNMVIDGDIDGDSIPDIVIGNSGAFNAFQLSTGSDGTTIQFLSIINHPGTAIFATGSNNHRIIGNYFGVVLDGLTGGGVVASAIVLSNSSNTIIRNNVIANFSSFGIDVTSPSTGTRIFGNLIGVGTDQVTTFSAGTGIRITSDGGNNQIGGSSPDSANVIVAATNYGITIDWIGLTPTDIQIYGNFIGITQNNLPLGNNTNLRVNQATFVDIVGNVISDATGGEGIVLDNGSSDLFIDNNFIGTGIFGLTAQGNAAAAIRINGSGNNSVISNNLMQGGGDFTLRVNAATAIGPLQISSNKFGTDITGQNDLGAESSGAISFESTNNIAATLSNNIIAYTSGWGVSISNSGAGTDISISQNEIFENVSGGIQAGGANQNGAPGGPPGVAGTTITGSGISPVNAEIEVFGDNGNQGRVFLGTTTAAAGSFSINVGDLQGLQNVTYTISDNATYGNTSPFSAPAGNPVYSNLLVTNLSNGATVGSFISALSNAISNAGPDTVKFHPNLNGGSILFPAASGLIMSGANANGTYIDGDVDNDSIPDITIDGQLVGNFDYFLRIQANNITVKNLIIVSYTGTGSHAINIDGGTGGTRIIGNYIGNDGSTAFPNTDGILISAGVGNIIGDSIPKLGNIISGNLNRGVNVDGAGGTANNKFYNNKVGLAVDGISPLGNGSHGIVLNRSSNNEIGNGKANGRNIISDNGSWGIQITGTGGTFSNNNNVRGNFIGTDASGLSIVGSQNSGVGLLNETSNNMIGDTIGGQGNIIGGHLNGVDLSGAVSNNNRIYGNYIGVGIDGNTAIPNTFGVVLNTTRNHRIGDVIANSGNIISGNLSYGIWFNNAANRNWVLGNLIGLNDLGTAAVSNGIHGINIFISDSNNIGDGTINGANVISGSTNNGVNINNADRTALFGNYIGSDAGGSTAIPNQTGIEITGNSYATQIGGISPGFGNVVSGNSLFGINLSGIGLDSTRIEGNYIGTQPDGLTPLPNANVGLYLANDSKHTTVGGNIPSAKNVISGNSTGIGLNIFASDSNKILGNYIGLGVDGLTSVPNDWGVRLALGADHNEIGDGSLNGANFISNNNFGVRAESVGTSNNKIHHNYIGLDTTRVNAAGNNVGVRYDTDASTDSLTDNTIAYSSTFGVEVDGANTDSLIFFDNKIFKNTSGGINITGNAQQNILPPTVDFIFNTDSLLTGTASPNALIRIFADSVDQAQFVLDTTLADGAGNWSKKMLFLDPNLYFTAMQDSSNNSSSFSAPLAAIATSPTLVTSLVDDGAPGSLGFAVNYANSNPGPDTIRFDAGIINGNIAITATHVITDNYTVVDGDIDNDSIPSITISEGAINNYAFQINSLYNEIKFLNMNNFTSIGRGALRINGDSNRVVGNYIGTNLAGTGAVPNRVGVEISFAADGVWIGDTIPKHGNVISGNTTFGVNILGTPNDGTVIVNNYIGVDVTGVAALANGTGINSAGGNVNMKIGWKHPYGGNVISGNTSRGVDLSNVSYVDMFRNFIGTDYTGTAAIPNGAQGILIQAGTDHVFIGDTLGPNSNVISGNALNGIEIVAADSSQVLGNYVGTDITGLIAIPNSNSGIRIFDGSKHDIGGDNPSKGNVISGNTNNGIELDGALTFNNDIRNNVIGTDTSGVQVLGSNNSIVVSNGASRNNFFFNRLTNHSLSGLQITGATSDSNLIYGNEIYNGFNNVLFLGSAQQGVQPPQIAFIAPDSTTTGTSEPNSFVQLFASNSNGAEFWIDSTTADGAGDWSIPNLDLTLGTHIIAMHDSANNTSNFTAQFLALPSNPLHVTSLLDDSTGGTLRFAIGWANTMPGADTITFDLTIQDLQIDLASTLPIMTADSIFIDGDMVGDNLPHITINGINRTFSGFIFNTSNQNKIKSINITNMNYAIQIQNSDSVQILGNYIGTNLAGNDSTGTGNNYGILINNTSFFNIIGDSTGLFGNVISNSFVSALEINNGSGDNLVAANIFGLDAGGTIPLENGDFGIQINNSFNNRIGHIPTGRNIIGGYALSGSSAGIVVQNSSSNSIVDNYIGVNSTGGSVANTRGVLILGNSMNNSVGDSIPGAGNIISGNNQEGILINTAGGNPKDTKIFGNYIGTDITGTVARPNNIGIYLDSVSNVFIGGQNANMRNLISGNTTNGIDLFKADTIFIENNLIGLDVTGAAALGNATGVFLNQAANINIGNGLSNFPNHISANTNVGIESQGSDSLFIVGNFIGTDELGTNAFGNSNEGVLFNSTTNSIIEDNVLSSNTIGLSVTSSSFNNIIYANWIGTDSTAAINLANGVWGVRYTTGASRDSLIDNIIINHTTAGLSINGAATDSIIFIGNNISANVVDIEITGGAQGGVIPPVIFNVMSDSTVSGTSAANAFVHLYEGTGTAGQILLDTATANGSGVWSIPNVQFSSTNLIALQDSARNTSNYSLAQPAAVIDPFLVTIFNNDSVPGTLRFAIGEANFIAGRDTITFAGPGSINILNVLPPLTDVNGLLIDGDTDNDSIPDVTINASVTGFHGLRLQSNGNMIKNLNITGFNGVTTAAINIQSSYNRIIGNRLGTNLVGTAADANYWGIEIASGNANIIGDSIPKLGNLISGNSNNGMNIYNSGTDSTLVIGNIIGLDINGTSALGNGLRGLFIGGGAKHTRVGTGSVAGRNIISGNNAENGLRIDGIGTDSNIVIGNYIGTDITGLISLTNNAGLVIESGPKYNKIGNGAVGGRNVISGNNINLGVVISGIGTDFNEILGNYIGLNSTGTAALANSQGLVVQNGAQNNKIGDGTVGGRNIISGNTGNGVLIQVAGTDSNLVLGNYIGTNPAGNTAIANSLGINIATSAKYNRIGDATAAGRNIISGNTSNGIQINDAGTDSNSVLGNYIGTDLTGSLALANSNFGLTIGSGAQSNFIGDGTNPGRNVISGNGFEGVRIDGVGTSFNVLNNNIIGAQATPSLALANSNYGIYFLNGATSDTVINNIIAFNGFDGILTDGATTQNHIIAYNSIHSNIGGAILQLTNSQENVLAPFIFNVMLDSTVEGNSSPNAIIRLYGDAVDEAEFFLGETTADGSGNWSIPNVNLTLAGFLTATQDSMGNTSAFSAPFAAIPIDPFVITKTVDDGTPGTLSFAITEANNAAGPDSIRFDISIIGSTLNYTSALPLITEQLVIDGDIDGDTIPDIRIDGGGNDIRGFDIVADSVTIANLSITGFGTTGTNAAIYVAVQQHTKILGNYLGLALDGASVGANQNGISLAGSGKTTIGDSVLTSFGNLISGNLNVGINATNSDSIEVYNNFIGLDVTGLLNRGNGQDGAWILGDNTIIKYNAVGGNNTGIRVGAGDNIRVENNISGLGIDGNTVVANTFGLSVTSTSNSTTIKNNVLSGNTFYGLNLRGDIATDSIMANVFGNKIGTDITGFIARPNNIGIRMGQGAIFNQIGDTVPSLQNLISGNTSEAITIGDAGGVTPRFNTIRGNIIGEDAGSAPLANGSTGIFINGLAFQNKFEFNRIANNGGVGIWAQNAASDSNLFALNENFNNSGVAIQINAGAQANILSPQIFNVRLDSTVEGFSAPNAKVYLYADAVDQAEFFLDSTTADGAGNWSIPNVDLTAAAFLTAVQDSANRTSAFSPAFASMVIDPLLVTKAVDDGTPGTLRFALLETNSNIGPDTIRFSGPFTIALSSQLPTLTDNQTYIQGDLGFDGVPDIELDGTAVTGHGLQVQSASNIVEGLIINNFTGNGIWLTGSAVNNMVRSNYIGTNAAGNASAGNTGQGVEISGGANRNFIGDGTANGRNIISGNGAFGITMVGISVDSNIIRGNYIGVDITGTIALANTLSGVLINTNAQYNEIGGINAGEGNLISGNATIGIELQIGSHNNKIMGNLIGTNAAGTAAVPNNEGIRITQANNTQIGDGSVNGRNVISGNTNQAINISQANSSLIIGNYLGVDAVGNTALGNSAGIQVGTNSNNNRIGNGTIAGRNIIAGNSGDGIALSGPTSSFNTVNNNVIGFGADLATPIANNVGVSITLQANDSIMNNIITNNTGNGIETNSAGTDDNFFGPNSIYNNGGSGIAINTGSQEGVIPPVIFNIPPDSTVYGFSSPNAIVRLYADAVDEGQFYLNQTVADGAGVWSIPNVDLTAAGFLTATQDSAGSTSAFSGPFASMVIDPLLVTSTLDDSIPGTLRFAVAESNVNPGNDTIRFNNPSMLGQTINIVNGPLTLTDNGTFIDGDVDGSNSVGIRLDGGGLANDGIVINGDNVTIQYMNIDNFGQSGVNIFGNNATVFNNYVGTNLAGNAAGSGNNIGIEGAGSNGSLLQDNVVSGNAGNGVFLTNFTNSTFYGNKIGTNSAGTAAIPNADGFELNFGSNNIIGGSVTNQRNIFSGNAFAGLLLSQTTNNQVIGNYIGVQADGQTALANNQNGLLIRAQSNNNSIGDGTQAGANIIGSNTLNGIVSANPTYANSINFNYIGTDSTTSQNLGNGQDGIAYNTGAGRDTVLNNIIVNNVGSGIAIDGATTDSVIISQNRIYDNAQATDSIAIRFTSGSQSGIVPPSITFLQMDSTLRGFSDPNAIIELFKDNRGEKEANAYVATVVASPSGLWSIKVTDAGFPGLEYKATQTILGNTSELSTAFNPDFYVQYRSDIAGYDFGTVPYNIAIQQPFSIYNDGNITLDIDSIRFQNGGGSFFTLFSQDSTAILTEDSISFVVQYLPPTIAATTDTILIYSNDAAANPAKIGLQGIAINTDPVISVPLNALYIFAEDTADQYIASLDTTFTDANGDALTFTFDEILGGSKIQEYLNADSMYIFFEADSNGLVELGVIADDGNGGIVRDTIQIQIDPRNDTPVLIGILSGTFNEDNGLTPVGSLQAIFNDIDGDALTISIIDSAQIFTDSIALNDNLYFTTLANLNGMDSTVVRAMDASGTFVDYSVDITITAVNDDPFVANAMNDTTILEDAGMVVLRELNSVFDDVDITLPFDNLTYTFNILSGVNVASSSISTDTLYITTLPDSNGFVTIEAIANDIAAAVPARDTIQVFVQPVNDIPVLGLAILDRMIIEDTTYVGITTMSDNFYDIEDDSLVYQIAVLFGNQRLDMYSQLNDSLVVTPVRDSIGKITIEITALDDELTFVKDTFDIDIMEYINKFPNILNASLTEAVLGIDYVVLDTIRVYDFEVDNRLDAMGNRMSDDSLVYNIVSGPSWLSIGSAGELIGIPDKSGLDSVRVNVFDGINGNDTQTLLFNIHDVGFVNKVARIDTIVTGDDTRNYTSNLNSTYPLPVSYSLLFSPDTLTNWGVIADTSFVFTTSYSNNLSVLTNFLDRATTALYGKVYMKNDSTGFMVDSIDLDFTLRKLRDFIVINLNPDTLQVQVGNDDISHNRDFNVTNTSYLTADSIQIQISSNVQNWITTSNKDISLNSGANSNFAMTFDVLNMAQNERFGKITILDKTFGLDTVAQYDYSFSKFLRGAIVFKTTTTSSLDGQILTHSGFTFDWAKTLGTSSNLLSSIRLEHFSAGLVDSIQTFEHLTDSTFEVLNLNNGNYRLSVVLQDNLVSNLYGVGDTLLFQIDGAKVTLEDGGYWSLISPVTDTKETVSKLISGLSTSYYSWNNVLNDNFGAYEEVNAHVLNPNKAYWVKLPNGNTTRSMVYNNRMAVDTSKSSTQSTLAVGVGWHLIGSPWNHDIILGNQFVKVNGQFVNIQSATAIQSINAQVWEYIRMDSVLSYTELLSPTDVLQAKRGYWFYTEQATEIRFTPKQTLDPNIQLKVARDWSADLRVESSDYNEYLNFSVNNELSKQVFGKKPPKITSSQNFSVRINEHYSSVKIPNISKAEYERYEMSIVGRKGQSIKLNIDEKETRDKRYIFVQQIATGKIIKITRDIPEQVVQLARKTDIFLVYISDNPNFKVPFVPVKFALHQNYPNPFNPSTTVQFDLPYGKVPYDVTIQIYNLLGQKIKTLFKGKLEAGQRHKYVWEGKNGHGRRVSSGMYFYRVIAGSFIESKKMVLIK